MVDDIKNFRLSDLRGSRGYKRVLLQLFGLPGNGKSSFINSCKFVIDGGDFYPHADVADSYGGKTTERISYELTESIWMVDNRGMPTLDRSQTGEIFAQLGNLLPLNKKVEWVEDFNSNLDRVMAESLKEDNLHDLVVPVLIHSVQNTIRSGDVELYKQMLNTAREQTDVDPYVVLTHKYRGGGESMKSAFKDMGLKKIYILENYTAENQALVREKHEEIAQFLSEVLEDVKFRMKVIVDPKENRRKCLSFFIKYIKETNDLKAKEEYERQLREERQRREEESKNNSCVLQ